MMKVSLVNTAKKSNYMYFLNSHKIIAKKKMTILQKFNETLMFTYCQIL